MGLNPKEVKKLKIAKAMIPKEKLVTAKPTQTVKEAAELMVKHNVSSVIISADLIKAEGIVTMKDIVKLLLDKEESGFDTKLQEIMSSDLITVTSESQLGPAIQKLEAIKTHHLVVVDNEGNLAGILSSFDIVRERALDIRAHPWVRS